MPFVVRQPELEQLHRFPRDSMPGQGWVAFVSSEAGSGKPPLLNEFSRQGMRVRGEAVQDRTGHWVLGSPIDWEPLPAWVEAIIVERLHHLDRECLILLESASVQGQVFNAGVLAQVLGITEEVINTRLNGSLCKQHRLVKKFNPEVQDRYPLGFYQFRHYLVQKFLYHSLDEVVRKRLLRVTAYALERLFTDADVRPDTALTSAAYLAWHFEQAELIGKAVEYCRKAGEDAYRMSAFQPAMMNLEHGLALLKELPDTPERARLELAYLSVSTERWPLVNA